MTPAPTTTASTSMLPMWARTMTGMKERETTMSMLASTNATNGARMMMGGGDDDAHSSAIKTGDGVRVENRGVSVQHPTPMLATA